MHKTLDYKQEGVRKWQMHISLEPFSVGKFMLHRCDPPEYADFLYVVPL
jgi:hypothetical protein